MSTENKQKRPKYTLEFKKDAAKLVFEKGHTQEQAANNLGISKSALSRWVRAEQDPTQGSTGKLASINLSTFIISVTILRRQQNLVRLRMRKLG